MPQESEAVKLWRDWAHLNLTKSWKHDVDITVTDIELWKSILLSWFWMDAQGKRHNKAPGIKNLLTEYERLAEAKRDNEALALSTRSRERLSTGSDGNVSKVRSEPPSLYFRTG